MGKVYEQIDDSLLAWIGKQRIFFVATAPLSAEGLVNVSPKGMDTFRVLDPTTVAYLDYTGSGIETLAHIRENGRLVFMFCAFEGPPKIVRLHGEGFAHEVGTPDYEALQSHFDPGTGARAIIGAKLTRISDSCGYAVPFFDYQGERDVLTKWAQKKEAAGVVAYQQNNNLTSLDGLPGLTPKHD